jgi:hypothetical protein
VSPRHPSLKESLRAIERALADNDGVWAVMAGARILEHA